MEEAAEAQRGYYRLFRPLSAGWVGKVLELDAFRLNFPELRRKNECVKYVLVVLKGARGEYESFRTGRSERGRIAAGEEVLAPSGGLQRPRRRIEFSARGSGDGERAARPPGAVSFQRDGRLVG